MSHFKLPEMKYYIGILYFLFFLFLPVFSKAQMLETKYEFFLSAGMGKLNGHESNIFFPDVATQDIGNFNLTCTRKVLPWMNAGVSVGYLKLNSINLREGYIKNMTSYKGSIKGGGPVLSFHPPYLRSGLWNKLIPLIRVSSSMQFLESKRVLEFDNIIIIEEDGRVAPTVMMPEVDMGFGFSINPGVKYRITQKLGVYLGVTYSYSSFDTRYGREKLYSLFFDVGLSLNFAHYKTLYL